MAKMDVGALLSKAASKGGAKKSKSKTPQVSLSQHEEAIQTWLEAHSQKKDADARMKDAELEFLADAEAARVGECRRDGKYYSSVKVDGKITVSVQNRYKEISTDSWEEIKELFGEDKAEQYFQEKMTIALTAAALADQNILQKLISAVGAENLQTYFDIKQFVAPTEAFHEGRATNPELAKKAQTLVDSAVLQPYKPSVKVG